MSSTETAAGAGRPGTAGHGEPPVIRPRSLWRNMPFQTLWIGTSSSTLGVSVADIAYPLTILAITRSPALAGLFAALQGLGMLVAGLPAGRPDALGPAGPPGGHAADHVREHDRGRA